MPVNISLLPDEVIARGVTGADWSKLPTAFWSGQDRAQQESLQNLFSGGLPRDPNNPSLPDWTKAAEMLVRTGGPQQLQTAIGLMNLQAQRNLPSMSSLSSIGQPQERVQFPLSAQRDGLQPAEPPEQTAVQAPDGVKKPPDSNVTSGTETGIQYGPVETTPFPERPPSGSAAAAPAPQFTPAPTSGPVSGPSPDRFQVAQATPRQAPQAPMPGIPTQPQGKYTEAEALRQETIRDHAQDAANAAGNLGNKVMAETYQARANQAAAYAKDIRENLMRGQVKQTEVQVDQEKAILDESRKGYGSAQDIQYRLGLIDKNLKELGPQWTGAGANARAGFARTYNTTLGFVPDAIKSEFGLTPFDPAKVASWEDFNKQSLNLGFALARTLGAREAMQIVQQATASVPNAEQSYWGAQLVSSSMRQAAQREIDYHKYVLQQRRSGNSLLDADVSFNQDPKHSVQSYVDKALSVLPPPAPPMQKREIGKPYQTPRGFGIWRGNNTWEFP